MNSGASSIPVVLLVDDDADWLSLAVRALASVRCMLAVANDGRLALKLLEEGTVFPSLVLLDLQMPSMTGWAVVEALKQNVHTRGIPLVCVTGMTNASASGFVKVFRKPVDLAELVRFVRQHCSPRDRIRESEPVA